MVMQSDKMKSIQSNIQQGLEKESEQMYKEKQLKALDLIRQTQLATIKGLADLIKGDTTKEEVIETIKALKFPDSSEVVKAVNEMAKMLGDKSFDYEPLKPLFADVVSKLDVIAQKEVILEKDEPIDLSETNTLLASLQTAINTLKLDVNVEAPIVKVPQTKLTVEKVDLSEIKQPLLDIITAVKNIPAPIIEYTNTSMIEEKLDISNDLLKKIEKKNFGGGGGGGSMLPFNDATTGYSVQIPTTNGRVPVDIDMASEGIATALNQDQQSQLLDSIATILQNMLATSPSLQITDNIQRLRVVVDSISGASLGQSVGAGQTMGAPGLIPFISTGTNYFQGVYMVGQDWRQNAQDTQNISYNQMVDRISIV